MEMNLLEIVGWVATFVVIGSFLVNDMLKLRSINLVGATLWLIYGIIASSYSIMFLNIVVMSIQIFKISQLLKEKKKL
jgi:hypothetical protein|tara:strand:- start:991 stop:1224 length:234 start_codon:yes stop_codon:yes gene_type:complete